LYAHTLVATILLAAWACSGPRPDAVLLVTLDTLRADHVSCYGASPVATPNLDAIASRGARAEQAWSTVPLTTPAHASILTGLYPPAHGIRNNTRFRLPADVPTLAAVLRSHGYRTAAFVGSFTTSRLFGLDRGFEVYDDDMGHNPDGRPRVERRGDEVVARALAWLRERKQESFFLWVHLYDPHLPYAPPEGFARKYADDPYSGEVAFTDLNVGRLLAGLQEAGLSRRTVVAVLGDHGEGLGDHGEADHGLLLYESTLRVPFLIAAPGTIKKGTVIREPASLVDLVPTVMGLLQVPPPAGLHGVDLFAPHGSGAPRPLYAETLYGREEFGWSALYAIRTGSLKLIEAPARELYDVAADPSELQDLSASRPADASALAGRLGDLAGTIVSAPRLAAAVGLAVGDGSDSAMLERLESLGYVAGGGATTPGHADSLPRVGGRNPRDLMGLVQRLDWAQEALDTGSPEQATQVLETLRVEDPDNPQVLLRLAQAMQRFGRSADADARYRELVARHPTFYLGYRSYTDFLEREGRAGEARDLWIRLKALVPGYVGLEARIAQAEIGAGMARSASERLETYLATRPDDAPAWTQLARARERLDDSRGALRAYDKALDLQPTNAEAVRRSVALLLSEGRRSDALTLVEKLLSRAPGDPLLARAREDLAPH
jgi:arylsulfatase A-like enzyme/Tfp pilus assembly protein PilF